jgi:sugar phosphate permease
MKNQRTRIFVVCYFAYLFIYVARLNLSMAAPGLKELQILSMEQIGLLGSAFSVIYACGRLLSGILSDRIAPWKMISAGLVLCGISNLCFGFFPPFAAILLLWGVNALAQSMLWGSVLRILSAIYPASEAKKKASYMATTAAAGNLVGILLNSALINRFGLAWAFLVPGGITLIISLFVVCNTRHVQPTVEQKKEVPLFSLLKKPDVQQMLPSALIHGVLKDNISLWMAVYVMDVFGVNLEQSSYYILLIPSLGFLIRLLAPEVYRLAKERDRTVLTWGFAISVVGSLLLVFLAATPWIAVAYLSIIYMAISMINVCLLSFFPLQFAKEGAVASAAGVLDFATYLGTGISSMIFGAMIESFGYGSMFITWAVLCGIGFLLQRKK